MILNFIGKLFSVIEIPTDSVEAALATMRTAGDEQRNPNAETVRDIAVFDFAVSHIKGAEPVL